jgi:hypothetical protein
MNNKWNVLHKLLPQQLHHSLLGFIALLAQLRMHASFLFVILATQIKMKGK